MRSILDRRCPAGTAAIEQQTLIFCLLDFRWQHIVSRWFLRCVFTRKLALSHRLVELNNTIVEICDVAICFKNSDEGYEYVRFGALDTNARDMHANCVRLGYVMCVYGLHFA